MGSIWCTNHENKTVIYYYDATALGSNYAVNEQDFHWVIMHEFERRGWEVIDVYLGNTMKHDEKFPQHDTYNFSGGGVM